MAVPEGYRFRPDKYESINYLRRKVNGQRQPCNLVKEMDVYDVKHPSELFRNLGKKPKHMEELFCFTTLKPSKTCPSRSQRQTPGGTWKEQGSKPIMFPPSPRRGTAPAVSVGLKTSFTFMFINGRRDEPHKYIMHQFSLPDEKCRVVFCKIKIEDYKRGRSSSCSLANQEVKSEHQQQQGRNYEEEQQVVLRQAVSGLPSSSSFVEAGGGPSSSTTSLPPAGHHYSTIRNTYHSSFGYFPQQHQEYMTMNYYPPPAVAAASSSELRTMMTTDNNYQLEWSAGAFSTDVRNTNTTTTTYFVNNNHNTVELPRKYYYSEEQQQQYMNMTMNPSPSSAPECMNYKGNNNAAEVFPEGGYTSEQQQQQQQYMIMNPSSHSDEVQVRSSIVFGVPSSTVFSTDQGATHFHENVDMINDNVEEELLLTKHMVVPPPPPPSPEIREINENHHQAQTPPPPQLQSDKRLVQRAGILSEWIMAQNDGIEIPSKQAYYRWPI